MIHKVWRHWLRDMIFRSMGSGTSAERRGDIFGTRAIFHLLFKLNILFKLSPLLSDTILTTAFLFSLPIPSLSLSLPPFLSLPPSLLESSNLGSMSRFQRNYKPPDSLSKILHLWVFFLGNGSIAFNRFSERSASHKKMKIQEKKIFVEYM